MSRNTVPRQLHSEGTVQYGPRAPRQTKLMPYGPYPQARMHEHGKPLRTPTVVLLREICKRSYSGDLTQLKLWLAAQQRSATEPVVHFETEPDKQMQADFAGIGKGRDPLVAFVATLGYSRASYVAFGRNEDSAALAAGLHGAFDYFGGVAEHVLFDNPKIIVIDRDAYDEGTHRWNAALLALTDECSFKPRPCRVKQFFNPYFGLKQEFEETSRQ